MLSISTYNNLMRSTTIVVIKITKCMKKCIKELQKGGKKNTSVYF